MSSSLYALQDVSLIQVKRGEGKYPTVASKRSVFMTVFKASARDAQFEEEGVSPAQVAICDPVVKTR